MRLNRIDIHDEVALLQSEWTIALLGTAPLSHRSRNRHWQQKKASSMATVRGEGRFIVRGDLRLKDNEAADIINQWLRKELRMQRGGRRLEKAGDGPGVCLPRLIHQRWHDPFRILHHDTTVFKLAASLYQPCNDQTTMIMRISRSVTFLNIAKTQVDATKRKRRKNLQRTKTYEISCQ